MIYRARATQLGYGRPLGILMLEEHIPCPPGTPGNPTTFSHPVCYEIVRGVSSSSLEDPERPGGLEAFIAAGEALLGRGACAVAGNCGLMIVHQQALAAALPVPVLLSSLLQLPLIARMLAPGSKIGVLASSRRSLKDGHLRLAAAGADIPVVIASMDGCENFRAAVGEQAGTLDFERVQAEVVAVARALVSGNPGIGAILLECVDLPPYASAVQEAVELPVFDMTTLIAHARSGLVRRPFSGDY